MKKVMIHILGTIIILGIGASLFVLAINSDNALVKKTLEIFFAGRAIPLIGLSLFCLVLYIDALKRKMPYAFLWFLVMCTFPIIGILLYLAKRPPIPEPTNEEKRAQLCPHCGKYYEPPATFCPHCGVRVNN